MEPNKKTSPKKTPSVDRFPGVAVDEADNDKTSKGLVKDYTCILNDNPNSEKPFE